MEKLLFILPQIPVPPSDGGKQAIYCRIKAVSKKIDTSVIMIDINDTMMREKDIKKYMPFVKDIKVLSRPSKSIYKSNKFDKLIEVIKWIVSGKPRPAQIYISKEYRKYITEYIVKNKIDVVNLEFPFMKELVDINFVRKKGIQVKCVFHNIEHIFYKDIMKMKKIPDIISNIEINRLKSYEVNAIKQCDDTACISFYDAEYYFNEIGYNVKYLPILLNKPLKQWNYNKESNYILFPGSLSFEPNYDGIKWFCENVWNNFKKKYPDVYLKITGKIKKEVQNEFSKYKDIIFTGFITNEELENLYINSLFVVIPIFKGAGIKLKVIDTLSYEVPMIVTRLGAQGIFNEETLIPIANTSDDFFKYMNKLMTDESFCKKLNIFERELFKNVYDDKMNVSNWLNFYNMK